MFLGWVNFKITSNLKNKAALLIKSMFLGVVKMQMSKFPMFLSLRIDVSMSELECCVFCLPAFLKQPPNTGYKGLTLLPGRKKEIGSNASVLMRKICGNHTGNMAKWLQRVCMEEDGFRR